MGCCGGREKEWDVKPAQKWDYINMNDFRAESCFTPISYAILWIMLGVSLACYIADFSTMINLLLWAKYGTNGLPPPQIFNSAEIPRWTFTGCIALSYVLLVYRWAKAIRAMRSGGVAKSYLDPLAARIQSIRPGKKGRGYRRFLIFAELTKSKHGTEYLALFVYFAFEAWLRIIFAEGPRNAINAYTIYHLVESWTKQSPDTNGKDSGIQKFWAAAQAAANNNHLQVAVFFGMVFTIVIWVFAFIGLVVAFILYIMFLWHHIPKQDGGLRGYCKRKVDKSVEKIVSAKIKKALEKEQQGGKKSKKDAKSRKDGLPEAPVDLKRQPTVPVLGDEESAILPPYGTRPDTPLSMADSVPTIPDTASNFSRPGIGSRSVTDASHTSYESNAPLLAGAASLGEGLPGRSYSPAPGGVPKWPYTSVPGRSASPAPPPRPFTPTGEIMMDRSASPAPSRTMTPAGADSRPTNGGNFPESFASPGSMSAQNRPRPGGPSRMNDSMADFSAGRASPGPGQVRQLTPRPYGPGPSPGPRSASAIRGPNGNQFAPQGPPPRSNTAGPSAMGPPNGGRLTPLNVPPRSNTAGPSGNHAGRQSPASFNPSGVRNAYGPAREHSVQEYEMTPQRRPVSPSNGAYQAYRPAAQPPIALAEPGRSQFHPPTGGTNRAGTSPPQLSHAPPYHD